MRWVKRLFKGLLLLIVLLGAAMTALGFYVRTQYGLPLNGCTELHEISPYHIPPGIFSGVRECLLAGRTENAIGLYLIGGVYGRYDAQRVVDRTAHQIIPALNFTTFTGLESAVTDAFQEAVGRRGHDSDVHQRDCRLIRRIGPPAYKPTYMTAHGMGNFTGDDDHGQALVSDFDSAKAWEKVLTEWARCPAVEGGAR